MENKEGTTGKVVDLLNENLTQEEWNALCVVHRLSNRLNIGIRFEWSGSIDVISKDYSQIIDDSVYLSKELYWFKTAEKLPETKNNETQIPCLVYYKKEVMILVFNNYHKCWDDADGDDYCCDIQDVECWRYLPNNIPLIK